MATLETPVRIARPGDVPKLKPLPEPVMPEGAWRPKQKHDFLTEAYLSATEHRWPGADLRRWRKWLRSSQGKFFMRAAFDTLVRLKIEPQAWIAFALTSRPKTFSPYAPDVLLAQDVVERRASAFHSWRRGVRFALPCQTMGGEYEAAHRALLGVQGRVRALDAEWRAAELAGRLSERVASQIIAKYLPDWRELFPKIEATAARLDAQARALVAEGTFIWSPLVK